MAAEESQVGPRIEALIQAIRDAERELQALTGGQVDAVVSGSGETYLLREAQDQLVRSRDDVRALALRQQAIIDALPAHLALVNTEGTIVAVNAAWEAFGAANGSTDPRHGVGANYLDVSRAAGALGAESSADVADGLARVLRGECAEFSVEYPCHSPTEKRWFQVMITPVRDERLRGAVVLHLNITDKRESDAALRQSEDALRESRTLQGLAERMGRIGGWRIDLPTYEVVWSDQVCAIHGLPSGTRPTPAQAMEMYAPEHRAAVQDAITQCAERGVPFDLEVRVLVGKDRKWVRAIGQAQRSPEGAIVAVAGALQDITDQKRLEQQFLRAQRMESVGTLAGGIAHDLNNALTPILMSLELLRTSDTDPERLELLNGIEQSAKRGADMVRQVLTFARGVEGQRVPVQLRHLIREVERFARDTFPRNISVRAEVSRDVPSVLGDATQLQQVLVNLCVNARDAMPAGGTLTMTVTENILDAQYAGMTKEVRPGAYVIVQIEDSGSGIPPELLDRIFEPFVTTKEVGKGTGLGLSTSLAIIKSHGGFIRVYSEPGVGSRFRVYLPAVAANADEGTDLLPVAAPRGRGELILVVDDEPAVRDITQQTLETFGYRVLVAGDGAEGVATFAVHHEQIRLVLTDMMMPVMDGAALIEVILRIEPSARIIAASGLLTHQHALQAPLRRVQDFLMKPYTADTLLSTVRKVLDA